VGDPALGKVLAEVRDIARHVVNWLVPRRIEWRLFKLRWREIYQGQKCWF